MRFIFRGYISIALLLSALVFLTACGSQAAPASTSTPDNSSAVENTPTPEILEPETTEAGALQSQADLPVLRMALIPVLDVLPFFIAQDKNYFTEEGVIVEFVPASSALEREQLLIAGEVDGMLTDVIGPAITNATEPAVSIVAISRRAYENAPLFRLLAAPNSEVNSAADLAGVPIGISENSVIQYLADRLLESAGVDIEAIAYESVPSIPTRFALMMEGQLGASILPDPLASAAIEAGAILVADDTAFIEENLSQSVLSFSNAVLEQKPDAVRAFLRAWYRAVDDLNANPNDYRQMLLDNTSVPESVQDTYTIPPFPVGEITSEAVWDDVNDWLVSRGIIEQPAAYADSVDASFLP